MFARKTLTGNWFTDTVDGRCKSIDGNKYCQVFANTAYFFPRIYPMDSKRKSGDALKIFCQEFGIPEKLTFYGSKEHIIPNTEFMKQIHSHGIDFHTSEADIHNQNPEEGVIGELRRKWYRIMVRRRIPKQFWDYGLRWVSEISYLTHTTAGTLGSIIQLQQVTGDLTFLNT